MAGSISALFTSHCISGGCGDGQEPHGRMVQLAGYRLEPGMGERMEQRPAGRWTGPMIAAVKTRRCSGTRRIRHWVRVKPEDWHQHREAQGQQNRDGKFPDAVDVVDQPGVFTGAFGQLDGGGAAQEQGPEHHEWRGARCRTGRPPTSPPGRPRPRRRCSPSASAAAPRGARPRQLRSGARTRLHTPGGIKASLASRWSCSRTG